MDRGLILYLHGFCSSPASWKSRQLGEELARQGRQDCFVCPTLSPVPDEALAQASRLIDAARQENRPVTLVGSSLGGHYATCLAEKHDLRAAVINPAVISQLDLDLFIGEHANFHTGERFRFTDGHAAQLLAQVVRPTPERYWLLQEEGDEVLDWRQARDFYAGSRQTILAGGDHSFTQFPRYITQLIEFAGL